MAAIDLKIPYSEGITYGRGFESLTGKVRGFPLRQSDPTTVPDAGGQKVYYYFNKVETISELKTQLGLSAEVNARFGLFGASAKLDYAESASFNSYSVFVVARVQVTNAFKTLERAAFDDEALKLLETSEGRKRFTNQFGDSFVSGMSTGGEACAVLELRTETSADQKSLSTSLSGSYGPSSAEVDFTTKVLRATENRFLKISMYQAGGVGVETTNDVNEVIRRARTFAAAAQANPVPYQAQVVDYDTLDHPGGETWVDLDRAAGVLKQYAVQKDRLLRLLSDIGYVRDNPAQFEEHDSETLNAAAGSIADRLNKLTDNANQAVKNAAEAQYLDVGVPEFTLPKRIEGALINVVSLVGLRMKALLFVQDNPTAPYSDYEAWVASEHEPGTRGMLPSRDQYAFLASGIKLAGYIPVASHLGVLAYWSWVTKQEPASGQMASNATVRLTTVRGPGGSPPPGLLP